MGGLHDELFSILTVLVLL
jgi:hypothetical protein